MKYNWNQWEEVNKALGFKTKKPNINEQRRTSQRTKFCKCKSCGGQMTYIPGTNLLVCHEMTEKEKIKKNEDGTETKFFVREECGAMNIVSNEYTSYMNYLFN